MWFEKYLLLKLDVSVCSGNCTRISSMISTNPVLQLSKVCVKLLSVGPGRVVFQYFFYWSVFYHYIPVFLFQFKILADFK